MDQARCISMSLTKNRKRRSKEDEANEQGSKQGSKQNKTKRKEQEKEKERPESKRPTDGVVVVVQEKQSIIKNNR